MKWLGDDVDSARVYALDYEVAKWGWTGSAMELADRARNLLERLVLAEVGSVPLVLVGHSMGGLHIKKMIELALSPAADAKWVALVKMLAGVAFFATPHEGSKLANLALKIPVARPTAAMRDLVAHGSLLRELDTAFRALHQRNPFPVLAFFETKTTARGGPLGWAFRAKVVDEDSANPKLPGVNPIGLDGDHSSMCQLKGKNSQAYLRVKSMVNEAVTKYVRRGSP